MHKSDIDIKEDDIVALSPELLTILLKDHTLSTPDVQVNIFWATDNYSHLGEGFAYADQITVGKITGDYGKIIIPRAAKTANAQKQRSREMAEVFTPSWICNKQNNLVDNAWFGVENVFNIEIDNPDGTHSWKVNENPISFPEGINWRDYVGDTRMEITCGEAPYLVSRYDTVSGEYIPIEKRIGLLDRKLRVVSENTVTTEEWLEGASLAFKNIYGYEWQGDNLVLAREALLYTFIDYFRAKFGKMPSLKSLAYIAYVISWNIWQMDGLKGVIPGTCHSIRTMDHGLFDDNEIMVDCEGCRMKNIHKHNGIYCKIRDWKEDKVLTFVSLIRQK